MPNESPTPPPRPAPDAVPIPRAAVPDSGPDGPVLGSGPSGPVRPAPDYLWASFTERGPWILDRSALAWAVGIDGIRERTKASVAGLTAPRRLPPGLHTARVVGHVAVALAGWVVVERRARRRAGVDDVEAQRASITGLSRRLRERFAHLGPTYIKLGQILSSGRGIFPDGLVNEFAKLRDRVPAESFATVIATIENELGAKASTVFRSIEPTPIAAASIAQVHAATLLDGTDVVIKVQRPGIGDTVRKDLAAMAWIAPFTVGRIPISALANPPALVEVFAETIVEELDFRLEAQNMLDCATALAGLGQRAIVVPRPHPEYVTKRLLVMEPMRGFSFDDGDAMRAAGVDTEAVLRAGVSAAVESTTLYGVFHGDLHGGNMVVLPDGRSALLDFGITGRLSPSERRAYLSLMVANSINDTRGALHALRDLGALPPDTDLERVIADLGLDEPVPFDPTKMTGEEMVGQLQDITKKLLGYGARLPKVLMLQIKNMVFLDSAIHALAPQVDLISLFGEVFTRLLVEHGAQIAADVGIDPAKLKWDPSGFKTQMGLSDDVSTFTYDDLQARRRLIRRRLAGKAE